MDDFFKTIRLPLGAILRRNAFGFAVLACAALAYLFPGAFMTWGGVKLTSLVVPAIQIIMFAMGTTLSAGDYLRVAKHPLAVATGVVLQLLLMPIECYVKAMSLCLEAERRPTSLRFLPRRMSRFP